jgi:hypothetical protein
MPEVPNSLEEAIAQAKEATQLALEAGYGRIQIELVIPEIALQAQSLALEFIPLFEAYLEGLKVIFPDTGAAALARRDWGETTFKVSDLGSRFTPIDSKVTSEDRAFLVVCPSAVEVNAVEKLCQLAGDRPVVLLIPQLEDVSIVGIGYAARQLRERFLSSLESCYYFRPLEGAVVLRSFPSLWQVWQLNEEGYELITEQPQKPMGEALETLLTQASQEVTEESSDIPKLKKAGLLTNVQRFLRALSQ